MRARRGDRRDLAGRVDNRRSRHLCRGVCEVVPHDGVTTQTKPLRHSSWSTPDTRSRAGPAEWALVQKFAAGDPGAGPRQMAWQSRLSVNHRKMKAPCAAEGQ